MYCFRYAVRMKVLSENRKAFFDYEILDRLEAGIVLRGDEVKAIRAGQVSLVGAFAAIHGGQLFLINANISPYSHAYQRGVHQKDDERTRSRKLLVHKKELNRLIGDISRKGITVIPLKLYLNDRGLVKVDLGIAKHKKAVNKKETIKERDIKRQAAREIRGRE